MLSEYCTIKFESSYELIVEKSKFIGNAFKVNNESEVNEKLSIIRKKYKDATHNCFAYIINPFNVQKRYSDDGEPTGTAGLPIINILEHHKLYNVLVIVTRYFGGIKLGASGLARAYSKTCLETIKNCKISKMTLSNIGKIKINYEQINIIENFLKKNKDIKKENINFDGDVTIHLITYKNWNELEKEILNLTNGKAVCIKINEAFYEWDT